MPVIPPAAAPRAGDEATAATERKLVMLLELLTQRRVSFASYREHFDRDYRSFQRDLSQLRKIGETNGFAISQIKERSHVDLVALAPHAARLDRDATRTRGLLAAVAEALGTPIVREFGERLAAKTDGDAFFSFVSPKLIDGTTVASTCAILRDAARNPNGRARVAFRYPDAARTTETEREVEPYRVIVRSGQFYLLGYDVGRRGWRIFAIDRFRSKPRRTGTCRTTREIPENYASDDAIGFFRGGERVDVTVEFAASIAASATARRWQADQRVDALPDGRARVTFAVSDPDEVIRWALGFGPDARVAAPPSAVARAASVVAAIAAAYAGAQAGAPAG